MSSHRQQRVRELLKRTIGEILRRELPLHEVGVITVNDVGLASDLRAAQVFVGVVGNAEQKKRAEDLLHQERKRLQGMLGREVALKYTPQLRFVVDDSIERGNKVIALIEELEKINPASPSVVAPTHSVS